MRNYPRDCEWAISGARQEGREEGILADKIQVLQELLEMSVVATDDLVTKPLTELEAQLSELQNRLRRRDV